MTKVLSSTIGYPRIGVKREWKKALEQFWAGKITKSSLSTEMEHLRLHDLQKQKEMGIDLIPVGDFSFYDHVLDTAVMFGFVPKRFQHKGGEVPIETYFDIARGNKESVASEMTKWFNTNYHYIVPELESSEPTLTENRLLHSFLEAKDKVGIVGKPVILGPITFLKLSKGYDKKDFHKLLQKLIPLYINVFKELENAGAEWIQIDEPILTTSISEEEINLFKETYKSIQKGVPSIKILLQTYFEAVEHYTEIISLPVAGIGLDFVHDQGANLESLKKYGFPEDKFLAAGIINGRNIWRSDLDGKLTQLERILSVVEKDRLIVQPSCSLLHVPVTVTTEKEIDAAVKNALAFADEKLEEAIVLAEGLNNGKKAIEAKIKESARGIEILWQSPGRNQKKVQEELKRWDEVEPKRKTHYSIRQQIQQDVFKLPLLPTTTIGSLPQTKLIRQARLKWRRGEWSNGQYEKFIEENISYWIEHQEGIGLDVLVHGEFERNDMVEYFGEKLDGFAFTKYGWVQSYGSRCVKPPIIYGDISLKGSMTVKEISYAQSLTKKPVKGMLTGPITILNWSFVRDDISRFEVTKQIALALKKEIKFLEENRIHMIQVDEPALREGLPLKVEKQKEYLKEAVHAFKLATSSVQDNTQIHTHMCYSDFEKIMDTIDQLDADVISIEAARSHGELISAFEEKAYEKGIGLGVYDIHSPRVPGVEEIKTNIQRALHVLQPKIFWINPDCGLKTRGIEETTNALKNMVEAARQIRKETPSEALVK
ncbi:5-methyltetrahydropteroyltriglutamate--homocysteine S-methyltransferase [Jeotgalibacillus marinus]|uniref:5-methyltetrahydropteroyltriglutamate--homocysteine methyltransferase n=1 Tax=Jeotgalibacillus marinus TaxID=86667 RepID=A0ABV3Q0C2_9BACL